MMTREIEVQILGKNFDFNIPGSIEPNDFMEIVDYVETKLKKIRKETQDLDSYKLGLLAAINITEEFFYLKREYEKFKTALDRIDRMVSPFNLESDEGDRLPIRFSS